MKYFCLEIFKKDKNAKFIKKSIKNLLKIY